MRGKRLCVSVRGESLQGIIPRSNILLAIGAASSIEYCCEQAKSAISNAGGIANRRTRLHMTCSLFDKDPSGTDLESVPAC